jgi:hypothetical protein
LGKGILVFVTLLMALVLCHRTHGYKWGLLNVRKGKYKGEHGGHRWMRERKERRGG